MWAWAVLVSWSTQPASVPLHGHGRTRSLSAVTAVAAFMAAQCSGLVFIRG